MRLATIAVRPSVLPRSLPRPHNLHEVSRRLFEGSCELFMRFTMSRFLIRVIRVYRLSVVNFRVSISPDVPAISALSSHGSGTSKISVRQCKQTAYVSIGDFKKQGFSLAETNEIPSTLFRRRPARSTAERDERPHPSNPGHLIRHLKFTPPPHPLLTRSIGLTRRSEASADRIRPRIWDYQRMWL